jgi:hypothetical protein
MLSNILYYEQLSVLILYFFIFIKPISSQGLACYKCMTTNPNDDSCRDPFSSLINTVHINCQVYLMSFFSYLPNNFAYIYISIYVKRTMSIFMSKVIIFCFFPSGTN